jgi:hypothetical protein
MSNQDTKTLVIILSETRASEITYNSFKENVLTPLNADLCICIGVRSNYDYTNPFYQDAIYRFLYDEPENYADAFDYASADIQKEYPDHKFMDWREYLKIPDQFMGGIKGPNQHPGSAGILLFYRWFLLKELVENGVLDKYDRFVITRSDFIYTMQHPPIHLLETESIWIPFGEHYGGYTDRHVVLSRSNIQSYLTILPEMLLNRRHYYEKMQANIGMGWNLERLIAFHLIEQRCTIKQIPYIMYSVRGTNGTTTWSMGEYSAEHGYYIKYPLEYMRANYYSAIAGPEIELFYRTELAFIQENPDKDPIMYRFN